MEREGCHILNCFLFEIRKLSVFGFVFYVYVNKLETNMAASIVFNMVSEEIYKIRPSLEAIGRKIQS